MEFKEQEKRRVIWQCKCLLDMSIKRFAELHAGYVIDKYISLMMGKPYMLRREHIVSRVCLQLL